MPMELLQQEYELADLDRLELHPENYRIHDLEVITDSIDVNGFYGAVVAQRSTGYLLAGHGRYKAAKKRGAEVLPVFWLDVDDEMALRILLGDNATSDRARNDKSRVDAILQVLEQTDLGLAGTGYSESDIVAGILDSAGLTDPDDAPGSLPSKPVSKDGDVWQLGPHRLVCGSATEVDDVRRALDDRALAPGGAYYVFSPTGNLQGLFRDSLAAAGLPLRQQIVWIKDQFVLGHSDYHVQHEAVLYGWETASGTDPAEPHFAQDFAAVLYGWEPSAGHEWNGGRKQTDVWHHPRPKRSDVHPTMKPVELCRRAIENNTRRGDLVLDTFAGSGSTLLAAHGAGRLAALVELDLRYCDVICQRWEEHTGIVPTRKGRGRTFVGRP